MEIDGKDIIIKVCQTLVEMKANIHIQIKLISVFGIEGMKCQSFTFIYYNVVARIDVTKKIHVDPELKT